MRREAHVPKGGPDGGDGGKGGDIWLLADRNVASLLAFRDHPHRKAKSGTHGSGNQRHGASGEDLIVHVPEGTTIRNHKTQRDRGRPREARRHLARGPRRAGRAGQHPVPLERAAGAELRRAG